MNPDELAFVNQQLAGMLKSDIALEGGLKQLCLTMKRGRLREELTLLEADLARGVPLTSALADRKFPPLFGALLRVGQASNDLPGVLTLLADYYQKASELWIRMKGVLVYPLIVLVASLLLSILIAVVFTPFLNDAPPDPLELGLPRSTPRFGSFLGLLVLQLWLPIVLMGGLLLAVIVVWRSDRLRHWFRWRVPGFREASLSQIASTLNLMLSRGCPLADALELLQKIESGARVQSELGRWRTRLASGVTRFPELTQDGNLLPPLFTWIVAGSGEDWAAGFGRAAEIYYARAMYRFEMMLYAALPVSVFFLGVLLIAQLAPVYLALGGAVSGLTDYTEVGM